MVDLLLLLMVQEIVLAEEACKEAYICVTVLALVLFALIAKLLTKLSLMVQS